MNKPTSAFTAGEKDSFESGLVAGLVVGATGGILGTVVLEIASRLVAKIVVWHPLVIDTFIWRI